MEEDDNAETTPPSQLQTKIDYLLRHVIPSIRERGYKLSDIAILTPNNDTLQRIAQAIILYNKSNHNLHLHTYRKHIHLR